MSTAYSDIETRQAGSGAERRKYEREVTVVQVAAFGAAQAAGMSERSFAQAVDLPRSTVRHWVARHRELQSRSLLSLLETKEGLACLHRLVWAAVFVLTLRAPGGIRAVCEFFRLSGLSDVAASSFGSVQAMSVQMLEEVGDLGGEMREGLAGLARELGRRPITVCPDETFHPDICLVAEEPVSSFILLEQYAERRDAETWTEAMKSALEGLPVYVVQSTSDEAAALRKLAKEGLDAHHGPDLFHMMHELHGATVRALIRRTAQAAAAYDRAVEATQTARRQRDEYWASKRGPGRPPNFAKRIAEAAQAEREAEAALRQAESDRVEMKEAINRVSVVYHAYDLDTGAARSPQDLSEQLSACFAVIDEIAERARLSDKTKARIDKARRVVAQMVDTLDMVHVTVAARVAALGLPQDLSDMVLTQLVPALYLERAAGRAQIAQRRNLLRSKADALAEPVTGPGTPLDQLGDDERSLLLRVAQDCADLFQRSSSCVEGRNSHLGLFHHGQHRLSDRKLKALTVVHNFHARRPGTHDTPAERFFGVEHEDFFEALLRRLPAPRRPAARRPPRTRVSVLEACA